MHRHYFDYSDKNAFLHIHLKENNITDILPRALEDDGFVLRPKFIKLEKGQRRELMGVTHS